MLDLTNRRKASFAKRHWAFDVTKYDEADLQEYLEKRSKLRKEILRVSSETVTDHDLTAAADLIRERLELLRKARSKRLA